MTTRPNIAPTGLLLLLLLFTASVTAADSSSSSLDRLYPERGLHELAQHPAAELTAPSNATTANRGLESVDFGPLALAAMERLERKLAEILEEPVPEQKENSDRIRRQVPPKEHEAHKQQHHQHNRHPRNENQEEQRRRHWEEQERRRVDEERRRANEPPDPSHSSAETYEQRMREWWRRKDEYERLQQRERDEANVATVRPLPRTTTPSDEENERKLQDYIRRNTPINVSQRTPASHFGRPNPLQQQQRPPGAHSRGPPTLAPVPQPPVRIQYQYQPRDHPDDERAVEDYRRLIEKDLSKMSGPRRLHYEEMIRARLEEYRQRLREERQRDYTGECTNTTFPDDMSEDERRQVLEDHRRVVEALRRGQDVRYQTNKGPQRPDNWDYEALRRAQEATRYQNKGPSPPDDRNLEAFRRAQEARSQTKGPLPPDQRSAEAFRRAQEARSQTKGPSPVDDRNVEAFRRAQEARSQTKGPSPQDDRSAEAFRRAQESRSQTKGPLPPDDRNLEAFRRAQEARSQTKGPPPQDDRNLEAFRRAQEARYQNKGPDNRAYEELRRTQESRYNNKGPSPPDDRSAEAFRRAQESRYQNNKGPSPLDDRYNEAFRRAQESRYQVKGPDNRRIEEMRRAQESRYQNKGPSPPDDRSQEAFRRAQESRYQNKGPSTAEDPNLEEFRRNQESRSQEKGITTPEPMPPEVWSRVYESRYRPPESGDAQRTPQPNHYQNRVRPLEETSSPWSVEQPNRQDRNENRYQPVTVTLEVTPAPWSGEQTGIILEFTTGDDDIRNATGRIDSGLPTTTASTNLTDGKRRPPSRYGSYPGQPRIPRPEVNDRRSEELRGGQETTSQHPSFPRSANITAEGDNSTTLKPDQQPDRSSSLGGNAIDFPGMSPNRPGADASRFQSATSRVAEGRKEGSPLPCTWAVVVCCRVQREQNRQNRCFEAVDCPGAIWDSERCLQSRVKAANQAIMTFYRASVGEKAEGGDQQ